jgi:molybdate transport system substrate-binding protein
MAINAKVKLNDEMKHVLLAGAAAAVFLAAPHPAQAVTTATINIAVAANFANPLNDLIAAFKAAFPHPEYNYTVNTTGVNYSSGELENQITGNCATTPTCTTTNPNAYGQYDLFLSADLSHALDLVTNHGTLVTTWTATATTTTLTYLFNYADGFLNLWDNTPTTIAPGVTSGLPSGWTSVGIANPTDAPYGFAAQQVLANVYSITLPNSMVVSTYPDIASIFSAVQAQTQTYGFVARSQICSNTTGTPVYTGTSHQDIAPGPGTYSAINQYGVKVANTTAHTRTANAETELTQFIAMLTNFTASPPSPMVKTLTNYCYSVPPSP